MHQISQRTPATRLRAKPRRTLISLMCLFLVVRGWQGVAAGRPTLLNSVDTSGLNKGNASSGILVAIGSLEIRRTSPDTSEDGSQVVFSSMATNLVQLDANQVADVFVRDLTSKQTERISVDSLGKEGDGASGQPSISGNGRYVAFESGAINLVPNDSNGVSDIFLRDRLQGTTVRISTGYNGTETNGHSGYPSISDDGDVAYSSFASNLVAGDSNGASDVFVYDFQTGTTTRFSTDSTGAQANGSSRHPVISPFGNSVAFESFATNLVSGDNNAALDVFRKMVSSGQTLRASVGPGGLESLFPSQYPSISRDGRYVSFESQADNFSSQDSSTNWDIYLRDLQASLTELISVGATGGASAFSSISRDGGRVAFLSTASGLVTGTGNAFAHIYLRTRNINSTQRISVNYDGELADGVSYWPTISGDARTIVYSSDATNLALGDTDPLTDIFTHVLDVSSCIAVSGPCDVFLLGKVKFIYVDFP